MLQGFVSMSGKQVLNLHEVWYREMRTFGMSKHFSHRMGKMFTCLKFSSYTRDRCISDKYLNIESYYFRARKGLRGDLIDIIKSNVFEHCW